MESQTKVNHQNLEYIVVRKLRFYEDRYEIKFLITGSTQIVTKKELESGEFDDKIALKIIEVMNSGGAEFMKAVADTKKEKTTPAKQVKKQKAKTAPKVEKVEKEEIKPKEAE